MCKHCSIVEKISGMLHRESMLSCWARMYDLVSCVRFICYRRHFLCVVKIFLLYDTFVCRFSSPYSCYICGWYCCRCCSFCLAAATATATTAISAAVVAAAAAPAALQLLLLPQLQLPNLWPRLLLSLLHLQLPNCGRGCCCHCICCRWVKDVNADISQIQLFNYNCWCTVQHGPRDIYIKIDDVILTNRLVDDFTLHVSSNAVVLTFKELCKGIGLLWGLFVKPWKILSSRVISFVSMFSDMALSSQLSSGAILSAEKDKYNTLSVQISLNA